MEALLDYAVPGSYLLEILLGEALVIVVEGLIYSRTFREHTPGRAWGYAITANMISATLGTVTASLIKSWI